MKVKVKVRVAHCTIARKVDSGEWAIVREDVALESNCRVPVMVPGDILLEFTKGTSTMEVEV